MITGPQATVTFSLDLCNWDYAINQQPELDHESFYTTTIHEIIHGIGFLDGNDASGQYDPLPTSFDLFVVRGSTERALLIDMATAQRRAALTGNNLFFAGPIAMAANPLQPGSPARLYAPSPYDPASSVSHWDRVFDPLGLMMLPSAAENVPEKLYLVAMERGVLYDIGYTPARPRLTLAISNGTPQIRFPAIIGAFYRLRSTTALTTGNLITNWTIIGPLPGIQATSNMLTLTVADGAARFFAVEIVPERFDPNLPQSFRPASSIPRGRR
jgi:hypothetical protein